MARGRRGGFKPPANYEPGRNPRKKSTRYGSKSDAPDAARETREPRVTRENRSQQKAVIERQRQLHRAPLPEAVHTTAADAAQASFAGLGLGGNLVRVLGELGAESPFPVQVATIPDAIAGRNVLGRANTGSGKTIAFGAALVERMLKLKAEGHIARTPKKAVAKRGVRSEGQRQQAVRNPKALILAPTRELALQIDRTVQPLARSVGFYTAQLVGGTPIDAQVHALERGVDIVIGTPGRIQDLVDRRRLDLREVLVSVIDEADHMCELGFLEPVQKVLRQTVNNGQRLLFSATLDGDVSDLVAEFLPDPVVHEAEEKAPGRVEHSVLLVRGTDRDAVITQLAKRRGSSMVFCRTRANAERITQMLSDAGVRATELHGNLSQARRELNLDRFSSGKVAVLVATDVAARGIHVDAVDMVLQADPPSDYKTYLHRTGRTGRAGSDGKAVLLISRARQERTEAMLAEAGVTPHFFGDFSPGDKLR